MKEGVSILICCYNSGRYLEETLRSVYAQTMQDFEVIIVDDGSTDDTAAIARRCADDRTRIVSLKENRGVSYVRNLAVSLSKNRWVALLDSDDLWETDKLEKQMAFVKEHPEAGLVFTGSAFIDEAGKRYDSVLHVPSAVGFEELKKQNVISCSSVLILRQLLLDHPFSSGFMHEDFAVWLTILREGVTAYGIDEPLLVYRLSRGSKSADKKKAALMNWNTYRFIGLSFADSLSSMFHYACRSIRKYRKLK